MLSKYDLDETSKFPIHMWTRGVPVEDAARKQLRNVANLPFIHSHVAVMPDVHWGMGATVGSVIPTIGAIVPAAVGVDIGCGMVAVKLGGLTASDLPDSLAKLRSDMEHAIPVGFAFHDEADPGLKALNSIDVTGFLNWLTEKHPLIGSNSKGTLAARIGSQLGTLGGGNHFIELCIDTDNGLWLMLHSGSRGIGNLIGSYFITKAKEEMETAGVKLIDKDLSYVTEGSTLFADYVYAVDWCQKYAMANRQEMLRRVMIVVRKHLPPFQTKETAINCHHNYVARERHFGEEVWLTRKGAVNASKGTLGIIPGSMGAKSFIVEGLGNPDSFNSCSHGAGRKMSRTAAKKTFSLEDHALATAGVECKKDESVIDETPGAYKDIDAVMDAQSDLVKIKATLKQVLCIKG